MISLGTEGHNSNQLTQQQHEGKDEVHDAHIRGKSGIVINSPGGKSFDIPAEQVVFQWHGDDVDNGIYVVQAPAEVREEFKYGRDTAEFAGNTAIVGELNYAEFPDVLADEGSNSTSKKAGLLLVEESMSTLALEPFERELETRRAAGQLAVWTVVGHDS